MIKVYWTDFNGGGGWTTCWREELEAIKNTLIKWRLTFVGIE